MTIKEIRSVVENFLTKEKKASLIYLHMIFNK